MSNPFDNKTLDRRFLDILAAARDRFGTDRAQREKLRVWYEEKYGKKPGAKRAYVPAEIIMNEEPYGEMKKELPPESEAYAEAASFDIQEQAAGFQADPEIRRIVENYAMERAKQELAKLGFGNLITPPHESAMTTPAGAAGKCTTLK